MVAFKVGMCAHDGGDGSTEFNTTDVTTRFTHLKLAINMAFGKTLDPNTLYCFIAPEFFFGSVALPKTEYRKLVELCQQLYAAQNFILVPGSMVTYSGSKLPWKKNDFLNRVPVFYGGQMMEYDKARWGGEMGANGVGTYRNGRTDNVFHLQFGTHVYSFAIEVCMDHDAGVLAERHGNALYDVHIVTANTVGHKQINTRARSYVLHCNAHAPSRRARARYSEMSVYDRDDNRIDPTKVVVYNLVSVWDLEL